MDKNVSLFSVELVTSAASVDEALAGVVEEFVLVVDGVAVILIGAWCRQIDYTVCPRSLDPFYTIR